MHGVFSNKDLPLSPYFSCLLEATEGKSNRLFLGMSLLGSPEQQREFFMCGIVSPSVVFHLNYKHV